MNSALLTYIDEHIKSKNRYFYHRGKYRTWSWSFNKVYQYAIRFTKLLQNLDIDKGDKILLKGPNGPEWVVVFIGCLMRGVVVVPLDLNSSVDFDIKVQEKVKAKLIACSKDVEIKSIKLPIVYFEDLEGRLPLVDSSKSLSNSVASGDLAEIVFTSGTTSTPKGVMISHGNIASNLKAVKPVMDKWKWIFRLMINPKILSLVPLSHMYGQVIGVFIPLMIGSSVVFTNNLSPQAILKAIREEKIWILGLLPKFMEILRDYIISKLNLDSKEFKEKFQNMKNKRWQYRIWAFRNIHLQLGWRFCAIIVGGAVLDKSVDEFWRCLAYALFQGYGLTETSPLVTLADPAESVAGSIGKVLGGQQIRLENNEILVKGPNVSPGYFDDFSSTRKSFSNGWFKTGDLAEIDENGNIFFKGRKDDVIVRSDGVNIFPEDIETVVKLHASVKDCAVIGLKHGKYEEIHAVLLLTDKPEDSPEEIIRKANKKLDPRHHIDGYSIWPGEDFPRTPTMKIKKNEVARVVSESRKGGEELETKPRERSSEIYELIKSFHRVKPEDINPEAKLESDLGLDSLDTIQLALAIEDKYNIEADELPITRDTSVKEIESFIKSPPEVSRKLPFYNFPYWPLVNFIRTIFQYILYPFISMLYRHRIYGKENLKNLKPPVVFASNHSSHLDTFVILYSLPLCIRKRVTAMMSIEHHFKNFFYRQGFWLRRVIEAIGFYLLVNFAINTTPLSRTYGFKQTMENIGHLLDKNWSVLIYPEGGVTPDGKIKRFESGIGMIASEMKVPVIPVRIKGLFDILHHGILPIGHRPRWPLVTVSFGKPMAFEKEDYKEITEKIEEAVRSL